MTALAPRRPAAALACLLGALPALAAPPDATPLADTAPEAGQAMASPSGTASTTARERARELFLEASKHAESQDWTGALQLYRRSYELYPHASTLYNVGFCRARLGDPLSAWLDTTAALDHGRFPPSMRLSPERSNTATAQSNELRRKLAVVLLKGDDVQHVEVNGSAVPLGGRYGPVAAYLRIDSAGSSAKGAAAVASYELLLNPGTYDVVLHTASARPRYHVELSAGEQRRLSTLATPLDAASAPIAGKPKASRANAGSSQHEPRHPASAEGSTDAPGSEGAPPVWLRPVGIAALSLGAAGVLATAVGSAVAVDARSQLEGSCAEDGTCPPEDEDAVARYQAASHVANVGLWLGVAGTTLGVAMLWVVPPIASPGDVEVAIAPGSLRVRGTF